MGYIKAEEVLPEEIIRLVQHYVDGENIYIPRKDEKRTKLSKVKLSERRVLVLK